MRVSNETKVGALTVIAITLIVLGFNFLRGKTIFKSGNIIHAIYTDTKGLIVSNPVFVNGYQVGTVFEIENQKDNLASIIVSVKLNEPYKIPNNSVATIQDNPLGISSISIVLGNANTYIKSGDTIQTAPANSLLGDFVNTLSPLGEKTQNAITSLDKVLNNINTVLDEKNKQNLAQVLENLAATTKSLNTSLIAIETMLQKQNGSIAQTFDNVNSFTKNLNDNNQKLNNIITNLDTAAKAVKDADLNKTIKTIQVAVTSLNISLQKLNSGNGTAAKLMNDSSFYNELQGTLKSINTLVDDVKVHPKRYINVSVFGKKDKTTPLTKPLADSLNHE
ncbi:MAG: MlaD family protein [Bacteroidetes bacterium]|nr:MlaD family protein [Bacteroidota bacterium]